MPLNFEFGRFLLRKFLKQNCYLDFSWLQLCGIVFLRTVGGCLYPSSPVIIKSKPWFHDSVLRGPSKGHQESCSIQETFLVYLSFAGSCTSCYKEAGWVRNGPCPWDQDTFDEDNKCVLMCSWRGSWGGIEKNLALGCPSICGAEKQEPWPWVTGITQKWGKRVRRDFLYDLASDPPWEWEEQESLVSLPEEIVSFSSSFLCICEQVLTEFWGVFFFPSSFFFFSFLNLFL